MTTKTPKVLWYTDRISESEKHQHRVLRWLVRKRSKYQGIGLIESATFGKCLILDDDLQSSEMDEFIYHEALVHPAMIMHGNPERVLILGGGEGATLRETLRFRSTKSVTMVDIDGEVISFCRQYLPSFAAGSFDDPRANLVIGDAREFIEQTKNLYDVMISDLCSPVPGGPAYELYTREFYEAVREKLRPDGLFCAQIDCCSLENMDVAAAIYHTVGAVFPAAKIYRCHIPSFDSVWGFCVAAASPGVLEISERQVTERISRLIIGDPRFYDAESHRGMFALPKYTRDQLLAKKTIITDSNPMFIYK